MNTYGSYMNTAHSDDDTVDAAIGSRISNALIVKHITVKHLSDVTGIAYPTLRRSLAGGRSLSFREHRTIAKALELTPADLLPESLTGNAA